MNSSIRKYGFLTVVSVLVFASASLAQTTTITFPKTAPGDGANFGGVYVDPYTATVGSTSNVEVICDDWSDNTNLGDSWAVNINTVAQVDNGTNPTAPLFGATASDVFAKTSTLSSAAQLYNAVAYLSSLLLNNTNPTQQTEISFALWQLTYPAAPSPETPGPGATMADAESPSYGTGSNAFSNCVKAGNSMCVGTNNYLTTAESTTGTNFNAAGWEILTPECTTAPNPCTTHDQEFMVYAPESSTGVLLAADLVGLLGLVFLFRRRSLRPLA